MRRSQIVAANGSSITFICLEMIKPGDVTTGTVHKETEQLNKQLSDGKNFAVFNASSQAIDQSEAESGCCEYMPQIGPTQLFQSSVHQLEELHVFSFPFYPETVDLLP